MKHLKWGILSILLLMVSCSKEASIEIVEGRLLELNLGDMKMLHVSCTPEDALLQELNWKSSDEQVAWCSPNGKLFAWREGTCNITVEALIDGEWASSTSQVVVSEVKMTSLRLDSTKCDMELGESVKLTATYEPSEVSYPELYWSSSDESVATVNNGKVKAVGEGECIISVANRDSSQTAQCEVSVYIVEMTSLSLSETKREIAFGECKSFNLKATYEPSEVTYPELYWSSSDESVATVYNGKVQIVGVGSCIISVANEDKTMVAECEVTVYGQEITAINILEEKTLERGQSFVLSATYEPSFVRPGCSTLYWQSSDESVAAVNKETGWITCVGVGECTITVGNTYNDVTATCRLTVLPILVKSISLEKTSLAMIAGQSEKIACTITPGNADNKEVKWESSNSAVATVSEDGTVTAIGKGTATISVEALDGSGCSAECAIVVFASDADYVEDYIENKMSIRNVGGSGIIINGIPQPGYSWSFRVDNDGDEKVYLKEVRGYGSSRGTVSINKYIEPGGSYSGSFNTTSIDWVFELNGIEVVRRY